MKLKWLIFSALLAFPFAFPFLLREARQRAKTARTPSLTAAKVPEFTPAPAPTPPETVVEPASDISPIADNPTPAPTATDTPLPPVPIENQESKIENPSAVLLEGTFTKEDRALIYEPDAKLQLPNSVFLSSPTGVMVSDEQQKIFAGDMQLLTTQQTISANEAVLTLQPGGSSVLTSKTLSIASHDESTPPMEIKGDNITLTIPAKKTPVAPAPKPPAPTPPAALPESAK